MLLSRPHIVANCNDKKGLRLLEDLPLVQGQRRRGRFSAVEMSALHALMDCLGHHMAPAGLVGTAEVLVFSENNTSLSVQ